MARPCVFINLRRIVLGSECRAEMEIRVRLLACRGTNKLGAPGCKKHLLLSSFALWRGNGLQRSAQIEPKCKQKACGPARGIPGRSRALARHHALAEFGRRMIRLRIRGKAAAAHVFAILGCSARNFRREIGVLPDELRLVLGGVSD